MTAYLMITHGSSNACGREVISGAEAKEHARTVSRVADLVVVPDLYGKLRWWADKGKSTLGGVPFYSGTLKGRSSSQSGSGRLARSIDPQTQAIVSALNQNTSQAMCRFGMSKFPRIAGRKARFLAAGRITDSDRIINRLHPKWSQS